MTIPYAIRGTGAYLPEQRITSTDISTGLGLDPGWIEDRTGIRARHRAAPDQAASDLAARAARRALTDAGIDPADLDLIVLGTSTPDELGPATACRVQALLGAHRAAAFDVAAACTGFVHALQTATALLTTRPTTTEPRPAGPGGTEPPASETARNAPPGGPYALVIGVEVYSRFLNPRDRATSALFGDGAAAAVLGPVPAPYGITTMGMGADGTRADDVLIPAGGSRLPATPETIAALDHTIHMDGAAVRSFIAEILPRLVCEATDAAGVKPADLALVVPHQPNPKLVAALAPTAGLDPDQLAIAGHDVGNIGAASLPYALHRALRDHRVRPGDQVLLAGFGAGLTWAHTLITWPPPDRPHPDTR
ncbi:3-oxoacyl-ACP synthase III family protein [Actinomadura rupiterrae]|uniref:3-oxoacyl-ACP synthase III family protein n=1 Tax=Actinomadura rupiterrae TaxID=559627 RepID=UPI0027E2EBA0|nr:ketoacyl-ACP synthase III [Actinomadura rupiterrae]MCP2343268.1 3-oxoacyl-[acyl-carrier-protein] synthase-3 [Actinomadura rupiterrae]